MHEVLGHKAQMLTCSQTSFKALGAGRRDAGRGAEKELGRTLVAALGVLPLPQVSAKPTHNALFAFHIFSVKAKILFEILFVCENSSSCRFVCFVLFRHW